MRPTRKSENLPWILVVSPWLWIVLLGLIFSGVMSAEERTWTSADGTKTFEGVFENYDSVKELVTVTRDAGGRVTFSIDKLSAADRAWVKANQGDLSSVEAGDDGGRGVLLEEDFNEKSPRGGLAARLLAHEQVEWAEGAGRDGSGAIRVAYVGYNRGSQRVVTGFPLNGSATAAKFEFEVKFSEDFQFVRGGKLHGLGPAKPITGGSSRRPEGWSARLMFRKEGGAQTYLYDQDPEKKWGAGGRSSVPVFKAGEWHRVVLEVVLNDPGKANGTARIWVDGKEVVTSREVEFRGSGGAETEIRQLLFSTFHGGQSSEWAPRDEKGNFTTVYAYFDNFVVTRL